MLSLTAYPESQFETYQYVRTVQGQKELHTVELALIQDLTLWPSYWRAWQQAERKCPGLGGLLVREERETADGESKTILWGLVFTQPLATRAEAFELWRLRWAVENQGFRELNQGGWLETQTWGRSEAAVQTSIALKIGAHNGYCLMRTELGAEWAITGLRDLQHQLLGTPPQFMVIVEDTYALLTAEELVTLLGVKVKTLLDPSLAEAPR
jgi:hypothetical protein